MSWKFIRKERCGPSLPAPTWRLVRRRSVLIWYGIAACTVMADQLAKLTIRHLFTLGEHVEVTSFFNLVYVLNPGAAFGFLASANGWQRFVFITLGLLVSAWLMQMLRQHLNRLQALSYSLILGGALGNIADRITRGQVLDYLDFHWLDVHWPAFNFADVAIISGAVLLIVTGLNQGARMDTKIIAN